MLDQYDVIWYRDTWHLYWRESGSAKRRSLGTTDRQEALRLAKQAADAVKHADASNYTVAEIWAAFRVTLEGRPSHMVSGSEGKALLPHFGALKPVDISEDYVRSYIELRTSRGKKPGTIIAELNRLAVAVNYAKKKGWISRVPIIPRPPAPPPKDRYLTKDEARAFLAAVKAPHVRLFVNLALATAARKQALLQLTWDRVDLQARRIDMRLLDPDRPMKNRVLLPMSSRAFDALTIAKPLARCDHVISYGGRPVRSVMTSLETASRESGIQDVTPHVFRHTAAVWMAEADVRMELISQYLGHTDSRITERVYARYSPGYMKVALDAIDF